MLGYLFPTIQQQNLNWLTRNLISINALDRYYSCWINSHAYETNYLMQIRRFFGFGVLLSFVPGTQAYFARINYLRILAMERERLAPNRLNNPNIIVTIIATTDAFNINYPNIITSFLTRFFVNLIVVATLFDRHSDMTIFLEKIKTSFSPLTFIRLTSDYVLYHCIRFLVVILGFGRVFSKFGGVFGVLWFFCFLPIAIPLIISLLAINIAIEIPLLIVESCFYWFYLLAIAPLVFMINSIGQFIQNIGTKAFYLTKVEHALFNHLNEHINKHDAVKPFLVLHNYQYSLNKQDTFNLIRVPAKDAILVEELLSALREYLSHNEDLILDEFYERGGQLFVTPFHYISPIIHPLFKSSNLLDRTELHTAVLDHDLKTCEQLLLAGHEVSATDRAGWTPLHYAVACNNFSVVNLLMTFDADVHAKDNHGWTPFLIATRYGKSKFEKLLKLYKTDLANDTERGSNINFPPVIQTEEKSVVPSLAQLCRQKESVPSLKALCLDALKKPEVDQPSAVKGLKSVAAILGEQYTTLYYHHQPRSIRAKILRGEFKCENFRKLVLTTIVARIQTFCSKDISVNLSNKLNIYVVRGNLKPNCSEQERFYVQQLIATFNAINDNRNSFEAMKEITSSLSF